jgi:hypothetical protein
MSVYLCMVVYVRSVYVSPNIVIPVTNSLQDAFSHPPFIDSLIRHTSHTSIE